jgi:hypothetical protein
MAYGKHWYRVSITNNVPHVKEFLYKNKLIEGVEGSLTPSMTEGIVDIVVIVSNKRNFERWFSSKKRFREATDPILLGFIVGKPVELPDMEVAKKSPPRRKKSKGDKFNSMKKRFDCRN